jgi:hypothetical protein
MNSNLTDIASIGNSTISIMFSATGAILLGTPQVLTANSGDNSNTIATTSFTHTALATALANASANSVITVAGRTGNVVLSVSDIANAAPLSSPVFTGAPQAPTPNTSDV